MPPLNSKITAGLGDSFPLPDQLLGAQTLTIGTTATGTAALQTEMIRVCGDLAVWMVIGSSGTATVGGGIYVAANSAEYIPIRKGQAVSIISATGGAGSFSLAQGG